MQDDVLQGFFELERGINSLQIEGSDCWYAEPEFRMEDEVLQGKLQGSMYGVVGEGLPDRAAEAKLPRA